MKIQNEFKKETPKYLAIPWDCAICKEIVFSQAPGIKELWNINDQMSCVYYLPLGQANTSILISTADLLIDPDSKQVYKDGKELHCTRMCYMILFKLVSHGKNIVARESFYSLFVDPVENNTISHDIARVRKLVGTVYHGTPYIKTVNGIGYVWNFPVHRSVKERI